jgi:hypothetical protein
LKWLGGTKKKNKKRKGKRREGIDILQLVVLTLGNATWDLYKNKSLRSRNEK